ncbi:hypothetical protein Tco_0710568, partial [Tanacetum coccineum]
GFVTADAEGSARGDKIDEAVSIKEDTVYVCPKLHSASMKRRSMRQLLSLGFRKKYRLNLGMICNISHFQIKYIKEESEIIGLLMIDDDLFTCDTPLGMIFNEFNRLSGMDDDLFTYEVKILELSYSPSVEQQMDDLDNGNLDVYERKLCYDECEKMYAEAVIFINKRLVREYDPSNVDFGEWLALKFSNYMTMDWYTKNALWIYWTRGDDEEVITDDELSNLRDGNLIKGNEIAEIFSIKTDIF